VPTYEYRCADCANHYETREGFDAPSTQPCPRCGGRAKRVLFAPPVVFKGSGFYVTDSRKNGDSATVGSSTGSESSSPASSEPTPAPAPASAPASTTSDD
jgi:putative FmdB family regulatory protein